MLSLYFTNVQAAGFHRTRKNETYRKFVKFLNGPKNFFL